MRSSRWRGGRQHQPHGKYCLRPARFIRRPPTCSAPGCTTKRSLFHLRFRSRYVFVPTFSCARKIFTKKLPFCGAPEVARQKKSKIGVRPRGWHETAPQTCRARSRTTFGLLFCAAPEVAHGLGRFGVVHPGPPMGLSSFLGRFGRRTARKARLGPAAVAAPGSARGDRYFPPEPRFRPAPTPGFGPFSQRGGAFASFPASAPLPCPLHDLLIPVLTTGGSITPLTSLECISICPSPHTSPIRRTLGWKKALEVI